MDQHARMKAKLMGYIQPEKVQWFYDDQDLSISAQYARALAHYRENRIDPALSTINALIEKEPDNPYFYELKGQMLVDFGRVQQALPPLQKAVQLRSNDGLFRTALAHAQIETATQDNAILPQAISLSLIHI